MKTPPRIFEKYISNCNLGTINEWFQEFVKCHNEKYSNELNIRFPLSDKNNATDIVFSDLDGVMEKYKQKYRSGFKKNDAFRCQCYLNYPQYSDNIDIRIVLQQVPVIQVEINEKMKSSKFDLYSEDYCGFLLNQKLAGTVVDFGNRFKGEKTSVYLFLKALMCKKFSKICIAQSKNNYESIIYPFIYKLKDYLDNEMIAMPDENNEITKYLKECDACLLNKCEKYALEKFLLPMQINLKEWLT